MVQVSPRHRVVLDEDYLGMIERAPREDFVVRVVAKRTAGETPLMTGEIVIASEATRKQYPLASRFPLHFRKTYYPGRLHGEPRVEYERQMLASALIDVPEPIGFTRSSFRSCLLPGTPLNRLTELGADPVERNITLAREMPQVAVAGLWRLLEEAHALLTRMQEGGMTHGDAHLHNFIVCPSPLEVLPIDFEGAIVRREVDAETWEKRVAADHEHIARLAVYAQCALGRQRGSLAAEAYQRVDALFKRPRRFREAIEERTYDAAVV